MESDSAPEPLRRIDSFPYRHRLRDVMTSPAVLVPAATTLSQAAREMHTRRISSVLVGEDGDDRAAGIVTERDVLTAVSTGGAAALERPITEFMTAPVEVLEPDALVYRAIGRMDRLGIRHLVVADGDGRAAGVITARGLLRQRAGSALALGDEVAVAADASALGRVRSALADLARDLLAEQVAPIDVAAVISDVMRGLTARATALAEAVMETPAPAPYCVMILGSGGRGESLLAPDQDNALIHAGAESDDPWFAELAERMTGILNEAGVPYCKGDVMASRRLWRHGTDDWHRQVSDWVARPKPENLMNVDIFYDFLPVAGDPSLADGLRRHALAEAGEAKPFLVTLSGELERFRPPVGLFGRLRTADGRVDLKIGGLFPIVAGARILALRYGVAETGTLARLMAVHRAGRLGETDLKALTDAHRAILDVILRQQIADIADGRAPGSAVDPRRIDRETRTRLVGLLRGLELVPEMVRSALAR